MTGNDTSNKINCQMTGNDTSNKINCQMMGNDTNKNKLSNDGE